MQRRMGGASEQIELAMAKRGSRIIDGKTETQLGVEPCFAEVAELHCCDDWEVGR